MVFLADPRLAVGRLTGLAALINTSFNSKGKPIVNRALTRRVSEVVPSALREVPVRGLERTDRLQCQRRPQMPFAGRRDYFSAAPNAVPLELLISGSLQCTHRSRPAQAQENA